MVNYKNRKGADGGGGGRHLGTRRWKKLTQADAHMLSGRSHIYTQKLEAHIGWRVCGHWHYASFSQIVAFVALQDLSLRLFLFQSSQWGSFVSHSSFCRESGSHESWVRSQMCMQLALKSPGARWSWSIEILSYVGFIRNTLVLVLYLHKNTVDFWDSHC